LKINLLKKFLNKVIAKYLNFDYKINKIKYIKRKLQYILNNKIENK